MNQIKKYVWECLKHCIFIICFFHSFAIKTKKEKIIYIAVLYLPNKKFEMLTIKQGNIHLTFEL